MSERTANAIWSGSSQAFPSVIEVVSKVWRTIYEWQRRAEDRAALATFDDRMLDDIGVTRAEAWRESRKPFWRV